MQQWLNLISMVGALLNLSAVMTSLAIVIINRRDTTSHGSTVTSHTKPCPWSCRHPERSARILHLQVDSGRPISEVMRRYLLPTRP